MSWLAVLIMARVLAAPAEPTVRLDALSYSQPSAGTPAAEPWWRDFGDPVLAELVDEGLSSNHDLAATWSRSLQAEALARQSLAGLLPSLAADLSASSAPLDSLGFMFGTGGLQSGDAPELYHSGGASLGLSWQADIWGRQALSWRSGRYDAQAAAGDRDALALALSSSIAGFWYDLVAAGAQQVLVEEQVAVNSSLLELAELRFERGEVTALDVLQQRQQQAGSRATLPAVRAQRRLLEQQLLVLLGRPPTEPPPSLPAALPEPSDEATIGEPGDLLSNRPDLRAAFARLQARQAERKAATRQLLPSLGFSGEAGRQWMVSEETRELDSWSIGAGLSVPIFQGGQVRAAVQAASAAEQAAARDMDQALLSALAEVEGALVQQREFAEQLAATREQALWAGRAFDESRQRYREGLATYVSVLTALQASQQAQLSALAAQRDLLGARIALHQALGGRWSRDLAATNEGGISP